MVRFQFRRGVFVLLAIGTMAGSAAVAADGAAVFKASCVTCHGDNLDGNGPAGQYMNPKPRNLKTDKFKAGDDRESVRKTVANGLKDTSMVGFSAQLKPDELTAVVDFICQQRGSCDGKPKAGKAKKK